MHLGRVDVLVGPVDVVNGQDGEVPVIAQVAQGDARAGLGAQLVDGGLVDVEGDGHAEEDAAFEAVALDDAARLLARVRPGWGCVVAFDLPIVVLLVHEACY